MLRGDVWRVVKLAFVFGAHASRMRVFHLSNFCTVTDDLIAEFYLNKNNGKSSCGERHLEKVNSYAAALVGFSSLRN